MDSVQQEVVKFSFYKNPMFILYVIYVSSIMISYLYMDESTKNSYVFGDTYRDDAGDIRWLDIFTLDKDINTIPSLLGLITSPFILYIIIGMMLIPTVVKPHEGKYQPYFYLLMTNIILLLILFMIHYMLNKVFGDSDDEDKKKGYAATFRTQWVLLVFLTPVILPIALYAIRHQD